MGHYALWIPLLLIILGFYLVQHYDRRRMHYQSIQKTDLAKNVPIGSIDHPFTNAYEDQNVQYQGYESEEPNTQVQMTRPDKAQTNSVDTPNGYQSPHPNYKSYMDGIRYSNDYERLHTFRHIIQPYDNNVKTVVNVHRKTPYYMKNSLDNVYEGLFKK